MFFLGIEVLSIALYFGGKQQIEFKSNEAGLKYFLMGSFASGYIVWYLFIYGAMGSFDVIEISELSVLVASLVSIGICYFYRNVFQNSSCTISFLGLMFT
jgi:NADH:ubiquinone oxidoreductase subunit 2 (subunit N)